LTLSVINCYSFQRKVFTLVTWELRKEPDGPTRKARPKKRGAFKCLSTLYDNIKILDMVWRTQLLWSSFWSCPIIKWRFVFWIIASVFETLFGELNCEQFSSLKTPLWWWVNFRLNLNQMKENFEFWLAKIWLKLETWKKKSIVRPFWQFGVAFTWELLMNCPKFYVRFLCWQIQCQK